jgi:hypothetical protein
MTININGNTYPVFEANQVLKHTDLKGLFDYLDGHHRLTRTHLIGMGIVCGLSVTFDAGSACICVSPGCGVTSEGYLIHLDGDPSLIAAQPVAKAFRYYQTVTVSASLFSATPESATLRNGANRTGTSSAETASQTYSIFELFESQSDANNRFSLNQTPDGSDRSPSSTQTFVTSHVVVIVCELDETKRDSCLADCDSRGGDLRLRNRFFLLPKTATGGDLSAETLLQQGYAVDRLPAPWRTLGLDSILTAQQAFWRTPDLKMRRFGHGQETLPNMTQSVPTVRLSTVKTFNDLLGNYYKICTRAIADIADEEAAFSQLFRIFSPFFSSFHPNTINDFSGLKDRLETKLNAIWSPRNPNPSQLGDVEAQYAIQYFYDYLSLLIAAYYELAEAAFDLMDDCAPDCQRFPKFLMLGCPAIAEAADPCAVPSIYRHHFVQPPIYNGNHQRIKQVKHLYTRLLRLCEDDAFFMLPFFDTPLAITPSPNRSAPLSQQAIPYYLNYPKIYSYWNYDACRKGIGDRHPAYFYPLDSNTPKTTTDLLVHRLDAYNFYRIEGHIGEERDTALREIKAYQRHYNLAFDVITLKLSPTIESLRDSQLSGHFDDLEADYGRMKDKFRKLWDKNDDWANNVALNTLRQVFFAEPIQSQTSGLLSIREEQVVNPVLALAQNADNYEFEEQPVAEDSPIVPYLLYVVDHNRNRVARFSRQRDLDESNDVIQLPRATLNEERKRIRETLAACFGLGKVWFEGFQHQTNRLFYSIRLVMTDTLELPTLIETGASQSNVSMALLWLTPFSVTSSSQQGNFIAQSEFHNFETLYGLLRGVPDDIPEPDLPFPLINTNAAECLNYFEFKGLMEVYFQRLEKLKALHLFHSFAEHHPGMEPCGGVPNGGTFVLVYVDGEEVVNDLQQVERNARFRARTSAIQQFAGFPLPFLPAIVIQQEVLNRTDIVVADFCLPYRCCSDTPAVSYVMAKPRPIVLLEKSAFCEDDETLYEFILDPAGGILKGEGSFLEGDTYYFQPSRVADIDDERTVTFTYVVDGSYDTFTVAIYPEPTGTLSIEDGAQYCNDADSEEIRLDTSSDPAVQLVRVTVGDTQIERFDPSQYAQNGEQEDVVIVGHVRDRRTNCENTIPITVTVHPLPNPAFHLIPPSDTSSYCAEGGEQGAAVTFVADDPEVTVRFEVDGAVTDEPLIYLDNYYNITEPVNLTVVHFARNEAGCTDEDEQTITIYPIPRATIDLEPRNICSSADPVSIQISSSRGENVLGENDTIQAFINTTEIEGAINVETLQFIPESVIDYFGADNNRVRVRVTVTVEGEGGCSSSVNDFITVYRTPDPDFEIGRPSVSPNGVTVPVTITQLEGNVEELSLQWSTEGGTIQGDMPNFVAFYPLDGLSEQEDIVIRLTVTFRRDNVSCISDEVVHRIRVPNLEVDESTFFDQRRSSLNDRLQAIGAGSSNVEDSRAFRESGEFINVPDKTIEQFEEVIGALQRSFRRAGPEWRRDIIQIVAIATAALFDYLAQTATASTDLTELEPILTDQRLSPLNLSQVQDVWDSEALKPYADEALLEYLEGLL